MGSGEARERAVDAAEPPIADPAVRAAAEALSAEWNRLLPEVPISPGAYSTTARIALEAAGYERLRAALTEIRGLHRPAEFPNGHLTGECAVCHYDAWPCRTAVLAGAAVDTGDEQ